MPYRVWVLITGALRSELHIRTIFIQLLELVEKGIIEQIVLSTWVGEIDKYSGLRQSINEAGILLVETQPLDKCKERNFNDIGYEIQRVAIAKGLKIIPNGVLVVKMRTDYNIGLNALLGNDFVMRQDMIISNYGSFPIVYSKKIAMLLYSFNVFIFLCDRYFYASKEDMEKMSLPVSYFKLQKYPMLLDLNITLGYVYQSYPLLRSMWNIVPMIFFEKLAAYCRNKKEEDLVLPRLIHRIYATGCVFLYTQVNLLNADDKDDKTIISVADLFRDYIRSNSQISKLVLGNSKKSNLAIAFDNELKKLALNLQEVHGYTYEEYMELVQFTEEELGQRGLIGEYPYSQVIVKKISREKANDLFLKTYDDEKNINKLTSLLDESFGELRDVYEKMGNGIDMHPKLRHAFLKAGLFDRNDANISPVYDYMKELVSSPGMFNCDDWNQSLRNIEYALVFGGINEKKILASYYVLVAYGRLVSINNGVFSVEAQSRLTRLNDVVLTQVLDHKSTHKRIYFAEQMQSMMVEFIYKCYEKKDCSSKCLWIVESLLEIKPNKTPFSSNFIDWLRELGKEDLVKKIFEVYPQANYHESEWLVSKDLLDFVELDDVTKVLEYTTRTTSKKDAEKILEFFWTKLWELSEDKQEQAIDSIQRLSNLFEEPTFLLKLNRFLKTNELTVSSKDMSCEDNFIFLIETLYRKNVLRKNKDIISDLCFGSLWRKVILNTFERLESDSELDFFSMKNNSEIWFYYTPYLKGGRIQALPVVKNSQGKTWPYADRSNQSSFAGFIRLTEDGVFASVELSSSYRIKAFNVARKIGYTGNAGPFLWLKQMSIPFEKWKSIDYAIEDAVNEALDEFCCMGKRLVDLFNPQKDELDLSVDTSIIRYCQDVYLQKNHLLIIAVRDIVGAFIYENEMNALKQIGVRSDLIGVGWKGYIFIKHGTKVVFEKLTECEEPLSWEGEIQEHKVNVLSQPVHVGNKSVVQINGEELSVNFRGLNFVVYDLENDRLIDSVGFDTHQNGIPCYR